MEKANAYLRDKIEAATSESEVTRHLVDAMVASLLADQGAVPPHESTQWRPSELERIGELLKPEIEAATPVKSDEGE